MKIYLYIGMAIFLIGIGWMTRSWYEDSKKVDAIEQTIKKGNEQVKTDRTIIEKSLGEQEDVNKTFNDLSSRPTGDAATNKLWNDANRAANKAGVS